MSVNAYLNVRQFVIAIGQPLLFLLLFLSFLFALASFFKRWQKHTRFFTGFLVAGLAAGYILLIWLHWQIARNLPLQDPTGQLPTGYFYIPPWVENEKLYFWGLVFGLIALFLKKQPLKFQQASLVSLAVFISLIFFTSNPFAGVGPLNDFHRSYGQYLTAMTSTSQPLMVKAELYHQLHGKMVGFYNSAYMWIHPPLLFLSYSFFVFAFLASLFMFSRAQLLVETSSSKEYFDKLAYNFAKPGFIFLTLGLLLGYPWAVEAWSGESWWYDPKINMTLMMWILYGGYLHARLYFHRRGMVLTTAVFAYLAFLSVVVTYISSYVIPGIHSTVIK